MMLLLEMSAEINRNRMEDTPASISFSECLHSKDSLTQGFDMILDAAPLAISSNEIISHKYKMRWHVSPILSRTEILDCRRPGMCTRNLPWVRTS